VVGYVLSPFQPCHISFLSPSQPSALQQQPAPAYNIQPITTSVSTMSVFSLPVSIIIPDLTILEFILWTMNLRKQIGLPLKIYYRIIKITTHTNSNYNTYKFKLYHIVIKTITHIDRSFAVSRTMTSSAPLCLLEDS
jgi:hypothetical protein